MNFSFLSHDALALLGFLSQDVTFEGFLEGNFTSTSHFKSLLGTRVRFNLRHFKCFLHDTLLADPHRRITYGAVWAIFGSAKLGKINEKTTFRWFFPGFLKIS